MLKKSKVPNNKPTERKCRTCGCTDNNCIQCIKAQGFPCHWVDKDLCSRCKNKGGGMMVRQCSAGVCRISTR